MKKQRRVAAVLASLVGVVALQTTSVARQVKTEPGQQYLVIEVVKLSTFEGELNDAAKQGFRLMMSTTNEGGARIQALLERAATPPDLYQYRMVATASRKTGSKEMNATGAEGFRAVPHTSMVKTGMTIFNTNEVIVMEKEPGSAATYEYQTIDAIRTSTFHKELKTAVDDGWRVVDMTYGKVTLERKKAR